MSSLAPATTQGQSFGLSFMPDCLAARDHPLVWRPCIVFAHLTGGSPPTQDCRCTLLAQQITRESLMLACNWALNCLCSQQLLTLDDPDLDKPPSQQPRPYKLAALGVPVFRCALSPVVGLEMYERFESLQARAIRWARLHTRGDADIFRRAAACLLRLLARSHASVAPAPGFFVASGWMLEACSCCVVYSGNRRLGLSLPDLAGVPGRACSRGAPA